MRLPKHATLVSYAALFVALGGTAYAATGGNFILGHANFANQATSLKNTGTGPALKLLTNKGTAPAFTVSNGTKIANLNADKIDGLNSTAFQRGSHRLYAAMTSGMSNQVAGKAGGWTFTLSCAGGGPAGLTVTGPGTIVSTTSLANGTTAGSTYVTASHNANGTEATVGQGAQMSQTAWLKNGTTIMKVQWFMAASSGGLFENCGVIGDVTPVP